MVLCARLRIERSGSEPWPDNGHFVVFLGKTLLISVHLHDPPRCINGYRRT